MNGATAEPWVSTSSPPNATIMMRIGSSQNFLRARMKRQSSARKSIAFPLELILHGFGGGPRWAPVDPVAVRVGLPLEPQRVLSQDPPDEADGQHRAEEHQSHHDRIHYPMQQKCKLEPKPIERR